MVSKLSIYIFLISVQSVFNQWLFFFCFFFFSGFFFSRVCNHWLFLFFTTI